MSYGDPFAGSREHFNPTGMDIHHHSTQPSAQYSLGGSPDMSDSSQNSLPRVHQGNRYAHMIPAPPASISPLPMGNSGGPYPFDNLATAETSWHLGHIDSLNEQGITNPLFNMQTPAHGAYNQHAPHHGFDLTLELLLQAHHQTPRYEPNLGGNSDIFLNYCVQNGPVLDTNTRMEGPFIPQDSSDAQLFYPTDNSSNPNPWLGGSQIEGMASANTTHPSPIASPQSPVDANEVASPQSVETEASQTGNANGQQNTTNSLPLESVDRWLQTKLLPQAASGAGSRGGKESWTCKYPGCKHRPYTRQDQARSHVAGHLGVKPFPCEHCQKRFVRPADCKRHMEKACKSPQATTTTGLRPLAPTPGGSPGIISPTSAGSPLQFPSDGGAKKEDAKGLQMIGPHRTLPRTKAWSKSSPRLQVRDSSSKKGRKGSKSPSSTGGSPTHPDDMWSQH